MNYVIAKLKKEGFKKLYSGDPIFHLPNDLDSALEYNPATILDDSEWFVINDFSSKEYCLELFKNELRTTDYSMINKNEISLIEYICSYDNNNFFLQKIAKSNVLAKKLFSIGDNVTLKKENGVIINELPDAIYKKETDKFYFKKLQTITSMFKGIEELFKEATNEEVEEFLKNKFIRTKNGYGVDKIKTMNRKRIALAMETLKTFSKKQRNEVLDYTYKYYPTLEYDKGVFTIGDEDELKYVLWGIEQRYYTTQVTNENRVANSVIILG